MFEKVNPGHPDKIADRIAGALVDLAYSKEQDPRIAVEVLIGHGKCTIIAETSVRLDPGAVEAAVTRIAGRHAVEYIETPQDPNLAKNQEGGIRCGDNGIFKGVPATFEQRELALLARLIYAGHPYDGKYIIDRGRIIICQSNTDSGALAQEFIYLMDGCLEVSVNPLGYWTGGTSVDTGATNRKLGSDMGDSVTGGGLHGKDLSKADVSVNIWAWLQAQETGKKVEMSCGIGDVMIDGTPYYEIVETAREYIRRRGGFEKFAEWGLI